MKKIINGFIIALVALPWAYANASTTECTDAKPISAIAQKLEGEGYQIKGLHRGHGCKFHAMVEKNDKKEKITINTQDLTIIEAKATKFKKFDHMHKQHHGEGE